MSAWAVRAAVERTRADARELLIRAIAAETIRQVEQYLREVAR
jgi:hypothetical protein